MIIIGHRGARALAPENTLTGVRVGMRSADYVEVDVRFSSDGIPVVIHDATLERTTDGMGRVDEHCLRDLRCFHTGRINRIPTLVEVLDTLFSSGGTCGLVLDLKDPSGLPALTSCLAGYGDENIILASSHSHLLDLALKLLPGVALGWIRPMGEEITPNTHAPEFRYFFCGIRDFTTHQVTWAHGKGRDVFVWTLGTAQEIFWAKEAGVDGIVCDDPALARRILDRPQQFASSPGWCCS